MALLIACLSLAGCDQFARVGASALVADTGPPPQADAGPPPEDAGAAADASIEDGGTDGGSCSRPVPAVCDPVENVGCSGALSMQCAIDYAWPLTGYCIFAAPPAPGMLGECFNSGITESCPALHTCFADQCAKICLCDDDCPEDRCCSQPIEATGFSVCGDC